MDLANDDHQYLAEAAQEESEMNKDYYQPSYVPDTIQECLEGDEFSQSDFNASSL